MPLDWDADGLVTSAVGLLTEDAEQYITEDSEDMIEE